MEIKPSPEQDSFIHLAIKQGRFLRPEDAVKDALELWEKRERARFELLSEIAAGDASFDGGELVLDSDESIATWVESVKKRGRARLTER